MSSSLDLIIVTGPTAVGKTELCVRLSQRLGTEMISADSMQVYRHLAIGTAKPSPEELQGVPCHLIDFVDPDHQYNAGEFVRDADRVIARLRAAGKIPLITGGTGMYLRSLLYGICEALPNDPVIREQLRREADAGRLPELYEELRRADPEATHITPNDRQRILRALEVYRATGRPITSFHTQSEEAPRYRARIFVLDRPRAELYARINARVDAMMEAGLLDEIRDYLAAGYSRENPAVRALGYRDLIDHLEGRASLEAAVAAMKQRTRNFAKRQLTWFRAMRDAIWISLSGRSVEQAAAMVQENLS